MSSGLGCVPVFVVGAATGAVVTLVAPVVSRVPPIGLSLGIAGAFGEVLGTGAGTCAKVPVASKTPHTIAANRGMMLVG